MYQYTPTTPTKIPQSQYSYNLNQSPYYYHHYATYAFQTQNNQYLNHNSRTQEPEQQQNQQFKNDQFDSPATLIKANIINNRTMIFSNYLQLDYALVFEEYLKIINNHQDYLKKLCTLRLDIPNIQLTLIKLKQLKVDILSQQLTQNKSTYENFIIPKKQQMIYQSISLQKNIEGLLNLQELPQNPYFQNLNYQDQNNLGQFDDQIQILRIELNQNEELVASTLTSIKHNQAQFDFLKDQKITKMQEELLDKEKTIILEFLKNKLSQSILNLIKSHHQEMSKIQQEQIYPIIHSKQGIVYIYEILSIIEGQILSINQIKQQILNFEQQIIQLKVNYHEFDEFYKNITPLYTNIIDLSKKVKQINCTEIQPLLQQYQLKQRKNCQKKIEKLKTEIKQLFYQGKLIENFNLKENLKQIESFNFEDQIQSIENHIQELENNYTRLQFSVPFSQIKKMSQMIIKFEQDCFNANKILLEIRRLHKTVTFVGYISQLNEALNNKYIIELQKISQKKRYIMNFKFCNAEILNKITPILNFQFPYFDWNEQFDQEKYRICIVQERYILVRETVIELSQIKQLCNEMKIIKQLHTLDNELEKSLTIIEKYLEIKEKLVNERIDLIIWPNYQFELMNQTSQFCKNLQIQTNERIIAIQQLNQTQLLQKLHQIFSNFNQQSQQQILALYNELKNQEFSQILKSQIQVVKQFLNICLQHLDDEIDKKFCQTNTYLELENELGGISKFNELRQQNNEENNNLQELRNWLYDQISVFMKQKLQSDFSNLFQLKVIQSQGGTNNYDPYKLQLRTDLLYPIYRLDINENYYCIQEKAKIKNIIDQPELRQLFQEFRTFLNQCTKIMQNNNNDNINDQDLILQLIEGFEKQLTLNIHLTDIQSIKYFHNNLKKWPEITQFEQQLLPLGIVLKEEYSKYLDACRQRVMSFVQGISVIVNADQENLIQDMIKFDFNNKICCLHELSQNYIYKDIFSIVIESLQGNLKLLSNHIVFINGKQLQCNDKILL